MADTELRPPYAVLDLPQLHTKPSASSLLSTLSQFTLHLSSWDTPAHGTKNPQPINQDAIPSYLTRIISSPLTWIPDDEDKEAIWESASKRLSERSGRSAMPSLSRTFKIPVPDATGCCSEGGKLFHVHLHEPSLTGDNLGHKTWIASYLLAKRLPLLLRQHYPPIRKIPPRSSSSSSSDSRPKVLELGAGTGLVGLAASGLFAIHIHLTDLAPIVPNLQYNIQQNHPMAKFSGSSVTAGELDWSSDLVDADEEDKYDIVFAADSLYAAEHSGWLVSTMAEYLRKGKRSRIFVELPLRPNSSYPEDFRRKMGETGFQLLEEGEEIGYDDWQTSSHEVAEVTCWWSVWSWSSTPLTEIEYTL